MPRAARKRTRESDKQELLNTVRARGLANEEQPGRPVALFHKSFLILYNGTLTELAEIDLKTLCAFSADLHGDGASDAAAAQRLEQNRGLDTENLNSDEFGKFARVLQACIEGEEYKKNKVKAAMARGA